MQAKVNEKKDKEEIEIKKAERLARMKQNKKVKAKVADKMRKNTNHN